MTLVDQDREFTGLKHLRRRNRAIRARVVKFSLDSGLDQKVAKDDSHIIYYLSDMQTNEYFTGYSKLVIHATTLMFRLSQLYSNILYTRKESH